TGLLDPIIEVRPSLNQIDDLMEEIRQRTELGERTLVTTLTKRMAEELNAYLQKFDIQTAYMHSDVDTMERIKILDDLRAGVYDVLIGVNLLREGLDLPEVSLVAILDADKEGFLRSHRSLTQTVGRAARNLNGRVIMYADKVTDSMRQTIEETERRRSMQLAYNEEHGITPQAIVKARNRIVGIDRDAIEDLTPAGRIDKTKGRGATAPKPRKTEPLPYEQEYTASVNLAADPVVAYMTPVEMRKNIENLRRQMMAAAKKMDFLEAARLRDEMLKMQTALDRKEAAQ
ncbi:MAG: UvrB/UvrC motif-containing protein, partial [Muribaculaceae bacterium]|nr:UvrB/UvrC motif-containing protein [Muribaculaceae bacterium]